MMASLLHIGHYATTTSVVDWVIAATVNLVETFVSQCSSLSSNELCTTLPLISELVGTLCQRLSGPQGVVDVCKLMITMMKHASIVEHFSTPQIAASFVAMARFATTPDSTACFSLAVCSIVDETNQPNSFLQTLMSAVLSLQCQHLPQHLMRLPVFRRHCARSLLGTPPVWRCLPQKLC